MGAAADPAIPAVRVVALVLAVAVVPLPVPALVAVDAAVAPPPLLVTVSLAVLALPVAAPLVLVVARLNDGLKTVADIAPILKQELNEVADENLVLVSIKQLSSIHLLEESPKITLMEARASRREFVQKVGAVGIVSLLLPLVTTMAVPTPAQAATCDSGGSCTVSCSSSCGSSCSSTSSCPCSCASSCTSSCGCGSS